MRTTCSGHAAVRMVLDSLRGFVMAKGHALWRTGPFVWCGRCGCHSSKYIRGFALECKGALSNREYKRHRGNLASGKRALAKKGEPAIATPQRLTVQAWLDWKAEMQGTTPMSAEGEDGPMDVLALGAQLEEDGIGSTPVSEGLGSL